MIGSLYNNIIIRYVFSSELENKQYNIMSSIIIILGSKLKKCWALINHLILKLYLVTRLKQKFLFSLRYLSF